MQELLKHVAPEDNFDKIQYAFNLGRLIYEQEQTRKLEREKSILKALKALERMNKKPILNSKNSWDGRRNLDSNRIRVSNFSRADKILNFLKKNGSATTNELAKEFKTSVSVISFSLRKLSENGKITTKNPEAKQDAMWDVNDWIIEEIT